MARFGVVLSLLRGFTLTYIAILLAATAHAQIGNLDDTNTPPIPGIGHDFIKMLGETVNPANGSVSLRIDLPMPKGRGLASVSQRVLDGAIRCRLSAQSKVFRAPTIRVLRRIPSNATTTTLI